MLLSTLGAGAGDLLVLPLPPRIYDVAGWSLVVLLQPTEGEGRARLMPPETRDAREGTPALFTLSPARQSVCGCTSARPKPRIWTEAHSFLQCWGLEREDERGVAKRPDLNELDVPEWAELALDKVEWRKLLQRIAL